jgi:putative membrane protein
MAFSFYTRSDATAPRKVPARAAARFFVAPGRAGTSCALLHPMGSSMLLQSPVDTFRSVHPGRNTMNKLKLALVLALAIGSIASVHAQAPAAINDAQIAHIAYTAGEIDVTAAKQALQKSHDKNVRAFAQEMARDHAAVNVQALALVKKLGVTPQDNPTSEALSKGAAAEQQKLAALDGSAYDKAYVANEVAFHRTVNDALSGTLIPSAHNAELKSLLETGLKLFQSHQMHAEHLAQELK